MKEISAPKFRYLLSIILLIISFVIVIILSGALFLSKPQPNGLYNDNNGSLLSFLSRIVPSSITNPVANFFNPTPTDASGNPIETPTPTPSQQGNNNSGNNQDEENNSDNSGDSGNQTGTNSPSTSQTNTPTETSTSSPTKTPTQTNSPSPTKTGIIKKWYTDGTKIMMNVGDDRNDSNDKQVLLHGVNSSGLEWGNGMAWNGSNCGDNSPDKDYGCYAPPVENDKQNNNTYNNISNWGFNAVRLEISWANLENTAPNGTDPNSTNFHNWNSAYLNTVKSVILKYNSKNIPVIISMHEWAWSPIIKVDEGDHFQHGLGMPVWIYKNSYNPPSKTDHAAYAAYNESFHTEAERDFFSGTTTIVPGYTMIDGYTSAWQYVASNLSTYSNVMGYDMYNEPGQCQRFSLKSFYEKLGSKIREKDPYNILFFQDCVKNSISLGGGAKPNISDSVYSYHLYPGDWPGSNTSIKLSPKNLTDKYLSIANNWNVPLWMGEFDYIGIRESESHKDPTGDGITKTSAMLQYYKNNNINWTYWSYDHAHKEIVNFYSGHYYISQPLLSILKSGF